MDVRKKNCERFNKVVHKKDRKNVFCSDHFRSTYMYVHAV